MPRFDHVRASGRGSAGARGKAPSSRRSPRRRLVPAASRRAPPSARPADLPRVRAPACPPPAEGSGSRRQPRRVRTSNDRFTSCCLTDTAKGALGLRCAAQRPQRERGCRALALDFRGGHPTANRKYRAVDESHIKPLVHNAHRPSDLGTPPGGWNTHEKSALIRWWGAGDQGSLRMEGAPMRRIRRVGAIVFAVCAFTVSVAPAALADAGGGPGSNHGCPGHQPPPPPGGGCHH